MIRNYHPMWQSIREKGRVVFWRYANSRREYGRVVPADDGSWRAYVAVPGRAGMLELGNWPDRRQAEHAVVTYVVAQ